MLDFFNVPNSQYLHHVSIVSWDWRLKLGWSGFQLRDAISETAPNTAQVTINH